MKRILLSTVVAALAFGGAQAQDTGTQQQLDKLSGQIQDLTDAQAQQAKRIEAVEKELADLTAKVNTPQVNDSASAADLKKLADDVQEIDRKRQADRELILANLEKLGKISASETHPHRSAPKTSDEPATPATGYEYVIKDGDTLGVIAKAFKDKGVKVTVSQIIKANPGMNPNALYVGKKIFIPDPSAK